MQHQTKMSSIELFKLNFELFAVASFLYVSKKNACFY